MQNNNEEEIKIPQDQLGDYIQFSAMMLNKSLNQLASTQDFTSMYNPHNSNNALVNIWASPKVPTQQELAKYIADPMRYGKELREVGQYLENAIMQYKRATLHFSSILTYKYEPIPISRVPKTKDKTFDKCTEKAFNIMRKLNMKDTFNSVTNKLMDEGISFVFIEESDVRIKLVEIPSNYCVVTGMWDYGFTFAVDLTYFDQFANMKDIMPEMYSQYELFIKMREVGISGKQLLQMQYYPMPIHKGWVFTFDPRKADPSPPLKGVFRDALEVVNYKDLLKTKTMLDTVMLLVQKIPRNRQTDMPIMDVDKASQVVNMTQGQLPVGVRTIGTPFDPELFNFSSAQTQNNIIGLGEELFSKSVGIAGTMLGSDTSSALALSYSLEGDAGFVDHLYLQYQNFVNFHLFLNGGKYKWAIKMFGNRYKDESVRDSYKSCVQSTNMPIQKLAAYWDYEPFEFENVVDYENYSGLKDKMKPLISGNQMSGKDIENEGGAKQKTISELGDAGENTRQYDSNANTMK